MDREARRRRIVERGSDRLALISGRIHSLDPPASRNSFSGGSSTYSTPCDNFRGHAYSASDSGLVFFQDHHQGGNDPSNIWSRHDVNNVISKETKYEAAKFDEEDEPEVIKSVVTPFSSAKPGNIEVDSSFVPQRVSKPSHDANAKPLQKPFGSLLNSITAREINSCIINSEDTRVFCSIAIAILVVLSHVSVKSTSLTALRPLYVILLSDLMIVASQLALYMQRGFEKTEQDQDKEQRLLDDGHNWGSAVKLLEFGLVLHQAIRAIFIDCSFYLVIVVCGLSLV